MLVSRTDACDSQDQRVWSYSCKLTVGQKDDRVGSPGGNNDQRMTLTDSVVSHSFIWIWTKPLFYISALPLWQFRAVSSSNDTDNDTGYKSYQCIYLCNFLHLSLYSPGSWDDSGLLTVFLLTSGIWFNLRPLVFTRLPFLSILS